VASADPAGEPTREPALGVICRWEHPVVPTAGGEATLLVQIRAEGGRARRRSPVDVAFVLDRSGSMVGDKLELAKRAVDVAAGHLGDDDRAALVAYDSRVDLIHPLQPATGRRKAALRLALHGIDPGGSTDLGGGWLAGCRELADAPPADGGGSRLRRALLLTDGLANGGITDPQELVGHALALRQRGIGTTTLGVGLDFDEALLAGLAEAGGGNFQFIETPDALPAFFGRELRELLTVAAAALTVSLTFPPGADADLIGPFPTERRGRTLRIALGDLPAGDERDLILALRLPPGAAGERLQFGATVAWVDPAADARRSLAADPPPLTRATPARIAETPADPLVAERAAIQRATAERRQAIALDRAGRFAESRARMRQAAAILAAAPTTDAVGADLRLSEAYAAASAAAPYAERDRKRGAWENALRARGRRDDLDSPDE